MECPDENTVSDYLRGKLSQEAVADVTRHADQCGECRELLSRVLGGRAGDPVSDGEIAALLRALPSAELHDLAGDWVGRILSSKYLLGARLGTGGMGVVYEATNTWTERRVAIKLLRRELSSDPELVQRFTREAQTVTRLSHPNIVDVLDLGQDPSSGHLFMVQEFLTGTTLRQLLDAEGRLPLARALEILTPIMDALATAHEAGIVHRDVKPENIFLSTDRNQDMVPKLIDFGISKVVTGEVGLQTGRALGTPFYMSPEQLRANDSVDGRADVWSVGIVLFEALAGFRPFDATNHGDTVARILTARAPRLRSADVPREIAAVIQRALERDRDKRFASMRAMLDGLKSGRRPARRRIALLGAAAIGLACAVVPLWRARSRSAPAPAVSEPAAPPPISTPIAVTPPIAVEPVLQPTAPPIHRRHRAPKVVTTPAKPPSDSTPPPPPILDP